MGVFGRNILNELDIVGKQVFMALCVFGGFEMCFGRLEEKGLGVGWGFEGLDFRDLLFFLEEMFVQIKFLHAPIVLHLIDIVNKYI